MGPGLRLRSAMARSLRALCVCEEGTVLLHLGFTAADRAPEVTVVCGAGNPLLGQTARDAASQLRLPCMDASARLVEADQSFSENRVEFVEWLESLSLKLSATLRPQLIDSKFTVDQPCGGLELT